MTSVLPLLVLLVVGVQAQPAPPTIDMLRARAQERMHRDRAVYSDEDLRALEALYQSANRDMTAPGAREILKQVVAKYPHSNRAGSAILYLAQISSAAEREEYLKTAIRDHTDTWYGDGVQVGAFARAQLAAFYSAQNRTSEGQALAREVAERFPGAVDHNGRLLVETLRKMNLL